MPDSRHDFDPFEDLGAPDPAPVAPHAHPPTGVVGRLSRWAHQNPLLAAVGLYLGWQAGIVQPWVEQTTGLTIPQRVEATAEVDLAPIVERLDMMTESLNGMIAALDDRAKTAEATSQSTLETLAAIEDVLEDIQRKGIKRRR